MQEIVQASIRLSKEALKPAQFFDGESQDLLICLNSLLKSLDTAPDDPKLATVVFMPIYSLLQQQHLGRKQSDLVLQIINSLCHKSFSSSPEFTFDLSLQLLSVALFLLNPADSKNEDGISDTFNSQELSYKLHGFQCIMSLIEVSVERNYKITASPSIPPLIFLILSALKTEPDINLNITLLSLLKLILSKLPEKQIILITPRVSSSLINIINVLNKRHFSVKMAAIDCLRIVICSQKDAPDDEVSQKLRLMYTVIYRLYKTTQRPELLKSIEEFAYRVLQCPMNIEDVDLYKDLMKIVASTQQITDNNMRKMLKKLAYVEIGQLNSIFQSIDEQEMKFRLGLLKAAVACKEMGNQELLEAVETAVNFKVKKSATVKSKDDAGELITSLVPYNSSSASQNGVQLSNMSVDGLTHESEISGLIKSINDPICLQDMCLKFRELDQKSELQQTEQLWIISQMVSNKNMVIPFETEQDLVELCYDNISKAIDFNSRALVVNHAANVNTSLCLYITGEIFLRMESDVAKNYVIDLIHPLFCLLGDRDSLIVKQNASVCIAKMAYRCGYSSPVELAIKNNDYVIDGISVQLNTLNISPSTLDSLASFIYICGAPILPYLTDVFQSIFVLLNYYHQYYAVTRCSIAVFGAITKVVEREIKMPKLITLEGEKDTIIHSFNSLLEEIDRPPSSDIDLENNPFVDELKEDGSSLKVNDDPDGAAQDSTYTDENSSDAMHTPDQAVSEWNYPIDIKVYETLEKIAEHCDKLMTHESPEIRFATLTLITMLVPFLSINEERYLPMIHKVWPEISARIFDDEVYVVEECFKCLESVSLSARSFVSKRIDDLWLKIVEKYGSIYLRKWPQFSKERRIQEAFNSCFASLINLNLSLKVMESTLVALRPALLRQDFPKLLSQLNNSTPEIQDLVYIVLLDTSVGEENIIRPLYANANLV
mgnify:FL=1